MNILLVTPSYKPAYVYGGPTRAMADLCEQLVKAGHSVSVYSTNANGKENLQVQLNQPYQIEGVQVVYHHRWTGDHSNLSPGLLWHVHRDLRKFDAVHLISWWNLVTIPALILCLARGIHPVISVHGSLSAYSFQHSKSRVKKWFQSLIGKRLLQQSILHVTTEKEATEVRNAAEKLQPEVIPNFISFPPEVLNVERDLTAFHLLFVGRLDVVKQIEFLIELMDQVSDLPVTLEIIGGGPESYAAELKLKSKHNQRIIWSGELDGIEKWNKIAKADLLVLPSKTENFGIVILEALSLGTMVLVSDQVGLKDYVSTNEFGYVAKTEVYLWKSLLNQIWNSREERSRIRHEAPARIKRDFNETQLVEEYIRIYRQCQKKNAG